MTFRRRCHLKQKEKEDSTRFWKAVMLFVGFVVLSSTIYLDVLGTRVILEIRVSDIISSALMLFLIVVTIVYARETQNMVATMKQANRINLRPYLEIQGAAVEMLSRLAKEGKNSVVVDKLFWPGEKSFCLARDSNTEEECLFYSLKNVGTVSARDIKHEIKVSEISLLKETERSVEIPTDLFSRDVVFPNAEVGRRVQLGKKVVYRDVTEPLYLGILIKTFYKGVEEIDSGTYFRQVKIRVPICSSTRELPLAISIIDQDEGMID